jgi:DNA-binding CsgD family transcriptional regulator
MLETVREYALECLAASREIDALRQQHATHYLELAEQAGVGLTGPGQAEWLERLEAEHDNLRAALRWLTDQGEEDLAVRLVGVLWHFWWLRGHLTEGRARIAEILQLPQLADPGPLRGRALLAAGQLALWQGDYPPARALLAESLEIAREVGEPRDVALALTFLGRVARDQGDEAARALGEESVELFRSVGDTWGCGVALHFLGLAVAGQEPGSARPLFEESARLFRERGDRWDLAMPVRGLGLVAYQESDYATAQAYFQEAVALFRERGDEWSMAMLLHDLGYVALSNGDHRQAAVLFGQSLEGWQRLGNTRGTVLCLAGLAGVAGQTQRALEAARLFGAAEAIGESAGIILEPTDQVAYAPNVAGAREHLSAVAFAAAWTAGRAMSLEEAVACARQIDASDALAPALTDSTTGGAVEPLTPREREVAALLARGLTNRQIAEALVITEGTANLHVKHILGKLGFGSRAQVAVWAAQLGLAQPVGQSGPDVGYGPG